MSQQPCVSLQLEAGICGFSCEIQACRVDKGTCRFTIEECGCEHLQRVAHELETLSIQELFLPLDRNPVYRAVQRAGCHAACPIAAALIKAAEVAFGLALPAPVRIDFKPPD